MAFSCSVRERRKGKLSRKAASFLLLWLLLPFVGVNATVAAAFFPSFLLEEAAAVVEEEDVKDTVPSLLSML